VTIRYGFLSTHPPTRRGLAIFNVVLAAQLSIGGAAGGVVRVVPAGDDQRPDPDVAHTQSLPWSAVATRYAALADRLVAANSRTAAATAATA